MPEPEQARRRSAESADADEERLSIDGIAMVRLLGPQDRLLTSIQREYPGVEVHVRGNEIAIRGDADVAAAGAPAHRRTARARALRARIRPLPK